MSPSGKGCVTNSVWEQGGRGPDPGPDRAPAQERPLSFRSPTDCCGLKLGPSKLYNPQCATHSDPESALEITL